MDTRHMQYFVALAETLHFGRAAARMNMTQPPFSRQIANLERALGVKLVERTSRHVALTPAGEQFLRDSRMVLARFENACRDARLVAEGQKGELRLGFMMHAAHRIVPRIVSRYTRLRPEVRVILSEIIPGEIERRVLQDEIDAAVTFAGRALPQLRSVPLFTDRLCLAVPSTHRLAHEQRPVHAGELRHEHLICAPATVAAPLRTACIDYFAKCGHLPRFRFEPQLQQTILRLVAAGLGVALVPASICDEGLPDIEVLSLADAPTLDVVLLTQAHPSNPAVERLVELMHEPDPPDALPADEADDGGYRGAKD